ncbi:MAG: hypothetical protein EBU01_04135 [Crocinitomicaceae bacterium]|nr:hypothetical protein [Crocinitomicaceae bacterium]
MPTYGLYISMYVPSEPISITEIGMFQIPDEAKWQLISIFFLFSAALPGLSFFALHRQQVITTIDMENQRERNIPLLVMFAYCVVLYSIFLIKAPNHLLPKYFYALPLSGGLVTGSFMYINRWIKISMHAGGAGILVGYLLAFFAVQLKFEFWILIAAVIASGLTITSRL